jgi:hypothetical protein
MGVALPLPSPFLGSSLRDALSRAGSVGLGQSEVGASFETGGTW